MAVLTHVKSVVDDAMRGHLLSALSYDFLLTAEQVLLPTYTREHLTRHDICDVDSWSYKHVHRHTPTHTLMYIMFWVHIFSGAYPCTHACMCV